MSANTPAPLAYCDSCGAEIPPDTLNCPKCGKSTRTAKALSTPGAPWLDPTSGSQSEVDKPVGRLRNLFSASGRIARLEYFLTNISVWIILIISWSIAEAVDTQALALALGASSGICAIVIALCANIKRLHDLDKSGWLLLISLIPFAGFLMSLFLLLKSGDSVVNQYGYENSGSVKR